MRAVDTTIARIDGLDAFDDNIVPVCVIRDTTDDVLANDRMLHRCGMICRITACRTDGEFIAVGCPHIDAVRVLRCRCCLIIRRNAQLTRIRRRCVEYEPASCGEAERYIERQSLPILQSCHHSSSS